MSIRKTEETKGPKSIKTVELEGSYFFRLAGINWLFERDYFCYFIGLLRFF